MHICIHIYIHVLTYYIHICVYEHVYEHVYERLQRSALMHQQSDLEGPLPSSFVALQGSAIAADPVKKQMMLSSDPKR